MPRENSVCNRKGILGLSVKPDPSEAEGSERGSDYALASYKILF